MNSYTSFDIFNLRGHPEFPDRQSTRSLDHDLFLDSADVCLQSATKIMAFFMALETEQKMKIPRATRVWSKSPTIPFLSF